MCDLAVPRCPNIVLAVGSYNWRSRNSDLILGRGFVAAEQIPIDGTT